MALLRSEVAQIVGDAAAKYLEENNLRVITDAEVALFQGMMRWREIAVATLESMASRVAVHDHQNEFESMKCLASGALQRLGSPDGATPLADLRVRIGNLEDERATLKRSLKALVDAISSPTMRECFDFCQRSGYGIGKIEKADLDLTIRKAGKSL